VLRTFNKVPDANDTDVLKAMQQTLLCLNKFQFEALQRLAIRYYNPATIAVLGLLLSDKKEWLLPALKESLNPVTKYKLRLSDKEWPNKKEWFIE